MSLVIFSVMKPRNIVILIAIVAIVIVYYGVRDSQDDTSYVETILESRQRIDRFMRTSAESPFAGKESFPGLKYFPPDVRYRIIARFEPAAGKNVVILPTNDGEEQRYREYGYAIFELDGIENRLLILEGIGIGPARGKLFLAFGDETSADETYGGGRYLDVSHNPGASTITLDFNKAYNPYCAYTDAYSCPLPPPTNLLKVAIRAGEKTFH